MGHSDSPKIIDTPGAEIFHAVRQTGSIVERQAGRQEIAELAADDLAIVGIDRAVAIDIGIEVRSRGPERLNDVIFID